MEEIQWLRNAGVHFSPVICLSTPYLYYSGGLSNKYLSWLPKWICGFLPRWVYTLHWGKRTNLTFKGLLYNSSHCLGMHGNILGFTSQNKSTYGLGCKWSCLEFSSNSRFVKQTSIYLYHFLLHNLNWQTWQLTKFQHWFLHNNEDYLAC